MRFLIFFKNANCAKAMVFGGVKFDQSLKSEGYETIPPFCRSAGQKRKTGQNESKNVKMRVKRPAWHTYSYTNMTFQNLPFGIPHVVYFSYFSKNTFQLLLEILVKRGKTKYSTQNLTFHPGLIIFWLINATEFHKFQTPVFSCFFPISSP